MKKSPLAQRQVISNAGPLIHLAKANALRILQNLYHTILIPEEVKTETVDKGKEKGHPDALQIENAMQQGWIKTIQVQLNPNFQKAAKTAGLRNAEALVIQHAYQNHLIALLDDEPARIFAITLGVAVRGTLGILIQATKNKILNHQEAIQTLDKLTETMYISADLYKTARKEIEKLKTLMQGQLSNENTGGRHRFSRYFTGSDLCTLRKFPLCAQKRTMLI